MANRDIWYVQNVTNSMQISISDLPKIPTLGPGHKIDMLSFHTKEIIELSKSLLICLNKGWVVVTKIEDGSNTTVNTANAQNALSIATVDEITNGGGGSFSLEGNAVGDINMQGYQLQLDATTIFGSQPTTIVSDSGTITAYANNWNFSNMSTVNLGGSVLNMYTGTGAGGGALNLDGGRINFANLNGNYNSPAYIATGTTDSLGNGYGGGISLFCFASYEMNWQNGVLKLNGGDFNGGGTLVNVATISGPSLNAPTTATATLIFDPNNLPPDVDPPQLIVLTMPGNSGHVFYYLSTADGSDPTKFNLNSSSIDSGFITNVINGANIGCSVSFDNVNTITFTSNTSGDAANQENGSTLSNCTITNFTGGGPGPNLLTIDSNLVVNGTLAFALPYTTLTEANNGINLDGTYDVYFLYVGPDNVQFTVNLPDPSTLPGRELTFINTGANSEFYPSIFGNISQQNSSGGSGSTYNLSSTTVKMLSDGTTWWITSQI